MRERIQLPQKAVLTELWVLSSAVGDIASGEMRLIYEANGIEYIVSVPYDTKAGPDGLMTVITSDLGNWLRLEVIEGSKTSYKEVLATKRLLDTAKVAFVEKPYKAIQQTGMWKINTNEVSHLEREKIKE